MNDLMNDFPALGFDPQNAAERLREQGAAGMLLTSPENVYYTTGYTCLPSSGNPILYTLRNRLPYFSHVDAEGQVTLLCWGFSAEGVNFGADRIVGFDEFDQAVAAVTDSSQKGAAATSRSAWNPRRRAMSARRSPTPESRRS